MEKTGLPRDHCGFSNLGTLNRLNSAYLYVFLGFGDSPWLTIQLDVSLCEFAPQMMSDADANAVRLAMLPIGWCRWCPRWLQLFQGSVLCQESHPSNICRRPRMERWLLGWEPSLASLASLGFTNAVFPKVTVLSSPWQSRWLLWGHDTSRWNHSFDQLTPFVLFSVGWEGERFCPKLIQCWVSDSENQLVHVDSFSSPDAEVMICCLQSNWATEAGCFWQCHHCSWCPSRMGLGTTVRESFYDIT